MQTIVHAIKIDSNNHGYTATDRKPALVMGQATEYAISLIDETGQPFEPQNIEGVNEWRFVLAGDFDQATPNCLTTSARYAGQGWFYADVSESWTNEMVSYLRGAEYKPIEAEIIGIGAGGETKSDWVFQFDTFIRNRVDAIGGNAPSAITPYMTSADLIAATVDYLDPILSGVQSVSARLGETTVELEGMTVFQTLAGMWEDIGIGSSNSIAIKTKVDTLATSAQAAATKTELHNFLTAPEGYTVPVLFSTVDNIFDTVDNYGCEIQETVSTISENVDSINGMVDDIDGRTRTLATSAQAVAIKSSVDSSLIGLQQVRNISQTLATSAQATAIQSALTDSTSGLAAIKTGIGDVYQYLDGCVYPQACDAATYARQAYEKAETLATSAQAVTLENYADGIQQITNGTFNAVNNGIGAIIENNTFGLVQLTAKVDALQTAIGNIQATLSAMSANG